MKNESCNTKQNEEQCPTTTAKVIAAMIMQLEREDMVEVLMHFPDAFNKMKAMVLANN